MKSQSDIRLENCTGCGLCVSVCPVYAQSRNLADSPRGKIALLRAAGATRLDRRAIGQRLERCTLCGRCAEVCPARLPLPQLFKKARRKYPLPSPIQGRWTQPLLARPGLLTRLQPVLALASKTFGKKRMPLAWQAWRPRQTEGAEPVWLFAGCIASRNLPELARTAETILTRVNASPLSAGEFACCGRPQIAHGNPEQAAVLARANLRLLASRPDVPLLVLCPGCLGEIRKNWPALPGLSPLEREMAQTAAEKAEDFFAWVGRRLSAGGKATGKAAWQGGCAQKDSAAAFRFARACGTELVDLGDVCCGGGLPRDVQDSLGQQFLAGIVEALATRGVSEIVTGCPHCLLQLQKLGRRVPPVRVRHLVQLMDEATASVHEAVKK